MPVSLDDLGRKGEAKAVLCARQNVFIIRRQSSRHCTKCSNERSKEIRVHCGAAAKSLIGAQRVKRQRRGGSQLNQANTAQESDPTDMRKVEIKKGWGRQKEEGGIQKASRWMAITGASRHKTKQDGR